MHHLPAPYTILLLALVCLSVNIGPSEAGDDKQQLQSVLQQLDQASKQRQRHNKQVEELTRQLECNWTQIRAYEICGQLHKADRDEHMKCSAIAKQNAARCLQNDGKKK